MKKIGDITNTADKNGEFTDGNVAAGTPPTQLMGAWFNSVQREILNVLAKAGIPQSATKEDQLAEAISQIISNGKYASTAYVDNGLNKKIDKANISGVKGNDNDKVPSLNLFTTETGKLATKADLATGLDGKVDKKGGTLTGGLVLPSVTVLRDSVNNRLNLYPSVTDGDDSLAFFQYNTIGGAWGGRLEIPRVAAGATVKLMQVGDSGFGGSAMLAMTDDLKKETVTKVFKQGGGTGNNIFSGHGAGINFAYTQQIRMGLFIKSSGELRVYTSRDDTDGGELRISKIYSEVNTTKDSNGFLGTNDKKTTLTTDEVKQSTGSSDTSVMSQKAVTDLLANTAKNTALKAANGWWKCGDTGLIYQWGRITTVNNKFSIAFPNAITSIVISPSSGTLSSQRIGAFNTTSFEATFEYGNNTGFYFAVGY